MHPNDKQGESKLVLRTRKILAKTRAGFENFTAALFISEGAMIALAIILILGTLILNPMALAALSLKNWLFGISSLIYCYFVGVVCYNAGIEHFPSLQRYKAPAPQFLKRLIAYVHDHIVVVKRYRAP